ncbi:MAG: cyclic nucleotide-binding domain-containing protein [Gammaproteobacteria bacterium]|nr:MAG: cyclic nucleotide-binding domain-containing protein [Gammaproteobacteria bacterium]
MAIDTDEIALILSGVKILQDLDVEVIEDIAEHIEIAEFHAGDMVVEKGQMGNRIYFIFEGKVEVQIPDPQGDIKRRIMLKKGEVVGEISLLINSTYSADIVAQTDTTAFFLNRQNFKDLIEKHPEFAEVMNQLMTSRMAQNGGINRVSKYELRGKLGEGNMATVFNAWDPELEREVAIKMLKYKLAYDDRFVDRFEREARTIASLNHPNIVNVFEVIEEFSTRFIVMEKLHGQNLLAILKNKGPLDLNETREILSQVASALQYAHNHGDRGIVHRDIKPSNIVVDAYGNIKLTDFGIASPPQDHDVNIEGTPSYIAPEIINGDLLDGRADIYALGVMAFHMLTKSLPFSASTLGKLLQMQVNHEPPDIRINVPDIDDELADFIESALSKDPDDRISDWNEIRRILRPAGRFHLKLDPDELAVTIRFRDTSYQQSASFINAMQKLLQEEGFNHQIEVHRGSGEEE